MNGNIFKTYARLTILKAKVLNMVLQVSGVMSMPLIFEVKGKRFLAKALWNN
ncbi:hypothetical protein [Thermococcus sp.]|uniref:hypothetical protein n=1 Tax=Thermococcus sp. TaxID=35749 RepID=UPI0026197675|nr:hypothetical protein [Thermococcus sp.]